MKQKNIAAKTIGAEHIIPILGVWDRFEKSFTEFTDLRKGMINFFAPYSNKYLLALLNCGLLPSFISKNKRQILCHLIRCESHRDIIIKLLNRE